jgi:hypothetical protein
VIYYTASGKPYDVGLAEHFRVRCIRCDLVVMTGTIKKFYFRDAVQRRQILTIVACGHVDFPWAWDSPVRVDANEDGLCEHAALKTNVWLGCLRIAEIEIPPKNGRAARFETHR